jgi:zinc transporter ZupT
VHLSLSLALSLSLEHRGIVSSVSLPIGAVLGMYLKVSRRVNSALLAFGAGALLFAITIELYGHAICEYEQKVDKDKLPMILLAVGSLIGSALFSGSNYVIEHQSNLRRKIIIKPTLMLASARSNLGRLGGRASSSFNLSSLSFSFRLPEELDPDPIPDDEVPFYNDESSSGVVRFRVDDDDEDEDDDKVGESAALTNGSGGGGGKHAATTHPAAKALAGDDDSGGGSYGALDDTEETAPLNDRAPTVATGGYQAAAMAAAQTDGAGSDSALDVASPSHGGEASPLSPASGKKRQRHGSTGSGDSDNDPAHDQQVGVAIWLGLLIDSLPESLVIGILATAEGGISITFILGVFLSNLPEALSSTVIMRRAGLGRIRILIMWSSIMILTGIGAFIGAIAFRGDVRVQAARTRAGRGLTAYPGTCGGSGSAGDQVQGARGQVD